MLNKTPSKVVINMKHIDNAARLTRVLKVFFGKASTGGDSDMLISKGGDRPEPCGCIGHDVESISIEHIIEE